jgi:hypothetical protein
LVEAIDDNLRVARRKSTMLALIDRDGPHETHLSYWASVVNVGGAAAK